MSFFKKWFKKGAKSTVEHSVTEATTLFGTPGFKVQMSVDIVDEKGEKESYTRKKLICKSMPIECTRLLNYLAVFLVTIVVDVLLKNSGMRYSLDKENRHGIYQLQ